MNKCLQSMIRCITIIVSLFYTICVCSQVLFNEISPNTSNSDGSNDAIVELINVGAGTVDIGCHVVSNSEWVVVIPAGTELVAGETFLIACGDSNNASSGSNPNPSRNTGINCDACDFPDLPIDLDVCLPQNAAYVHWASTGLTLDNQSAADGDQVVLWNTQDSNNDGDADVLDAVLWTMGSSGPSDNDEVATGNDYTLGDNAMAAIPPYALQNGNECFSGLDYTMPGFDPVTNEIYTVFDDHLTGCNSSFVRAVGDDSTGGSSSAWTTSEHPSPSFGNNSVSETFSFDGNLLQCTGATPIKVTYEVFLYQKVQVETSQTTTRTTQGSFVLKDGTDQIAWDDISSTNGTTTLEYTFTPTESASYDFVWNDDTSLSFNNNCCGTSSETIAASESNSCYSSFSIEVLLLDDLEGAAAVTCLDMATGSMAVTGITVGSDVTYELIYTDPTTSQETVVQSNSTGAFTLASGTEGSTDPTDFKIKVSNPCSSQTISSGLCMGDPPCPKPALDEFMLPMDVCPGEEIMITLDAAASENLEDGMTVDWFWSTDGNFNPFDEGEDTGVQSEITVMAPDCPADGANVIITALADTKNTQCRYIEIFNAGPCEADLGLYQLSVLVNNQTGANVDIISLSGTLGIGEYLTYGDDDNDCTDLDIDGEVTDLNILSFNGQARDGAQLLLLSTGEIIDNALASTSSEDGLYTDQIHRRNLNITNPSSTYLSSQWTNVADPEDGTFPRDTRETLGESTTTITKASIPILEEWCNSGDIHIKGVVNPSATSASCTEDDQIVSAGSLSLICPEVMIMGEIVACTTDVVQVPVTISSGEPNTTYTVVLTRNMANDGQATVTTDAIGNASTAVQVTESGLYSILEVMGGSCSGIYRGNAEVLFNPMPAATISGAIDPVCPGTTVQLELEELEGNGPFTLVYNTTGSLVTDDNEVIVGADGLFSIIVPENTTSSFDVELVSIVDEAFCSGTATGSVTIPVLSIPPMPSAGMDQKVCVFEGTSFVSVRWNVIDPGADATINVYDVPVGGESLRELVGGTDTTYVEFVGVNTLPTTFTRYFEMVSTDGCINTERLEIPIVIDQIVAPIFEAVAPICSGDALTALPMTSTNGITGTWSPALDNTSTTEYTFTPTEGECATPTKLTIEVMEKELSSFSTIAPICSGDVLEDLPTTSLNGVTGTWSPAIDNTKTTEYTFTPAEDECASETKLTIVVREKTVPTFEAVAPICSGDALTALPTTSTNVITGTWSPALDNTSTTEYTFTPTEGECAIPTMLTIEVMEKELSSFSTIAPICSGEELAALPTTSLNEVTGTWSPAIDNTKTTEYTFTPAEDECASETKLTIVVREKTVPTFDAVAPICSGDALEALPTTSTNGITGTWEPTLDNTNTTEYTFTPSEDACATQTTLTIVVMDMVTPIFETVAPICSGDALEALPTTSTNGITGTWEPALDNTSTTEYTFTPSEDACATQTTLTIVVMDMVTPIFETVAPICSGDALEALPTTSTNGISGTWEPALDNTSTTEYTFTPSEDACATQTTLTIVVMDMVTPTFDAVAPICSGDALEALPTTSTNGISGTWEPALDNTSTREYTFTPSEDACATQTTLTIVVMDMVTPTFDAVAPICSGDALEALPTSSTNGISGTWEPAINNTSTTEYTFTPSEDACATQTTLTIVVMDMVTPTFEAVAPICSGDALEALPTTSTNGISGTWEPALDNTSTTEYTFTPSEDACAAQTTLTIVVMDMVTPTFEAVDPICVGDVISSLTTISDNGITGSWSPALNNTVTTEYTFVPDAGQCARNTKLTIEVMDCQEQEDPTLPGYTSGSIDVREGVINDPCSCSDPDNSLSSNGTLSLFHEVLTFTPSQCFFTIDLDGAFSKDGNKAITKLEYNSITNEVRYIYGNGNTITTDLNVMTGESELDYLPTGGSLGPIFRSISGSNPTKYALHFWHYDMIGFSGEVEEFICDASGMIGQSNETFQITNVCTGPCGNETIPAAEAMTCNDQVQISLNTYCQGVTPQQLLEGEDASQTAYLLEIDGLTSLAISAGDEFVGSIDFSKYIGGGAIKYKITPYPSNGNSCWGTAIFESNIKPQLTDQSCSNFVSAFELEGKVEPGESVIAMSADQLDAAKAISASTGKTLQINMNGETIDIAALPVHIDGSSSSISKVAVSVSTTYPSGWANVRCDWDVALDVTGNLVATSILMDNDSNTPFMGDLVAPDDSFYCSYEISFEGCFECITWCDGSGDLGDKAQQYDPISGSYTTEVELLNNKEVIDLLNNSCSPEILHLEKQVIETGDVCGGAKVVHWIAEMVIHGEKETVIVLSQGFRVDPIKLFSDNNTDGDVDDAEDMNTYLSADLDATEEEVHALISNLQDYQVIQLPTKAELNCGDDASPSSEGAGQIMYLNRHKDSDSTCIDMDLHYSVVKDIVEQKIQINELWVIVPVITKEVKTETYCIEDTNDLRVVINFMKTFPDYNDEDDIESDIAIGSVSKVISFEAVTLDPSSTDSASKQIANALKADIQNWSTRAATYYDGSRPYLLEPIDDGYCSIKVTSSDSDPILTCGDGRKIFRTWTLVDWCTGLSKEHLQIVEVGDQIKPTITTDIDSLNGYLSKHPISTSPWTCEADLGVIAELVHFTDNCDNEIEKSVVVTGNFQKVVARDEPYNVEVWGYDDCGNRRKADLIVYVYDGVQPTPICQDVVNANLTPNPNVPNGGLTKVHADAFDAGSHDAGCGEVSSCVVRMEDWEIPVMNCEGTIVGYKPMTCHADSLPVDLGVKDSKGNCVYDGKTNIGYISACSEYVKFCCSDIGAENQVRVVYTDLAGNSNFCMVPVKVENKIESRCEDTNIEASCTDDIEEYLDGPNSVDACGSVFVHQDSGELGNCGNGDFVRTWYSDDDASGTYTEGDVARCRTTIVIQPTETFDPTTIKWPKHHDGTVMKGINIECKDERAIERKDADVPMGASFSCMPEHVETSPTWCSYDCGVIASQYKDDTLVANDACLKIIRHWTVIDWCLYTTNGNESEQDGDTFEPVEDWTQGDCVTCSDGDSISSNDPVYFRYKDVNVDGYYTFDQIIKVVDDTDPVITVQDSFLIEVVDGASFKGDTTSCRASGSISASAEDFCNQIQASGIGLRWNVTIFRNEEFESSQEILYSTGVFIAVEGENGDVLEVEWNLSDGCGNNSQKKSTVIFKDTKAPTPICIAFLETAVAEDGTLSIWAKDYDNGSFDNCTPDEDLKFGLIRHFVDFDLDSALMGVYDGVHMTCEDIGNSNVFNLDMYVIDECNNYDFCSTTLLVPDNQNSCNRDSTDTATIGGVVRTEDGKRIQSALVEIASSQPEYPRIFETISNGGYVFQNALKGENYSLHVNKEDDFTNGLSTLDVLLLQRHLLDISKLDSPYKVIAADLSGDERLSTLDIVLLRRIIMQLTAGIETGPSWRFVDARDDLNMNPFGYNDAINVISLIQDLPSLDWVGIKMGDLNLSSNTLTTRSGQALKMDLTNQSFEAGDQVFVDLNLRDFDQVSGFQFALEHEGLELKNMVSNEIEINSGHYASRNEISRVSWSEPKNKSTPHETTIVLEFQALEKGTLSHSLSLRNEILRSESYHGNDLELGDVLLNVIEESNTFSLHQNQPNPFESYTVIGFDLPKAAEAVLTVYDVTGKSIYSLSNIFEAGYNELLLNDTDIQATGVLYYTLSSGDYNATKRMIKIE